VQETVWGNPVSAGVEENTQFFVPVTVAESCTEPPAWGSAVGVAENEVILGEDCADSCRRGADDTVLEI
jgi:hypothetical protein